MFGFKIISDRDYEKLVFDNQTLRVKLDYFEALSKLRYEDSIKSFAQIDLAYSQEKAQWLRDYNRLFKEKQELVEAIANLTAVEEPS